MLRTAEADPAIDPGRRWADNLRRSTVLRFWSGPQAVGLSLAFYSVVVGSFVLLQDTKNEEKLQAKGERYFIQPTTR